MNIDFAQVLENFEGEELRELDTKKVVALRKRLLDKEITKDEYDIGLDECLRPMTLKSKCVEALLSEAQDERATGEDKVKRYELAKAIHMNDTLDVPAEGIVLLKERIGKLYLSMIVGQVFNLLEGKTNGGTDKPVDNAGVVHKDS